MSAKDRLAKLAVQLKRDDIEHAHTNDSLRITLSRGPYVIWLTFTVRSCDDSLSIGYEDRPDGRMKRTLLGGLSEAEYRTYVAERAVSMGFYENSIRKLLNSLNAILFE